MAELSSILQNWKRQPSNLICKCGHKPEDHVYTVMGFGGCHVLKEVNGMNINQNLVYYHCPNNCQGFDPERDCNDPDQTSGGDDCSDIGGG